MNLFNFQKSAPRFAAVVLNCLAVAALLCAAVFTSCDSKSKGSDGVKLLESITGDDGKVQKKFEYDGQNRIVKMYNYYTVEDLNSTTTITYNADNSVTTEEFYRSGNSAGTKKFVRNGNTITVEDKALTIDKNGYIVRQESGNDWFVTCQYQDGNRIKWEHSGGNSSNYSYDDKKSPFSNSGTPKWLLQHLFDFSYANKDNPLGYYFEGEIHGSVDYKYEYDSDGFPTKQTLQVSGSDYEDAEPEITRFTYIVKTTNASGKAETAASEKEAAAIAPAAPESIAAGENINELVPAGYNLEMVAYGDLNGDGVDDLALMVKGTDKDNVVTAREDYGPKEKKLTFRYKNSEFELVGYDVIMDGNKESREETSVNLSTKKKLVKTCVSAVYEENCEMCTPRCKFKEKWGDVSINGPVLLRKLTALNDVDGYMVDGNAKTGAETFTDARDGKTYRAGKKAINCGWRRT